MVGVRLAQGSFPGMEAGSPFPDPTLDEFAGRWSDQDLASELGSYFRMFWDEDVSLDWDMRTAPMRLRC